MCDSLAAVPGLRRKDNNVATVEIVRHIFTTGTVIFPSILLALIVLLSLSYALVEKTTVSSKATRAKLTTLHAFATEGIQVLLALAGPVHSANFAFTALNLGRREYDDERNEAILVACVGAICIVCVHVFAVYAVDLIEGCIWSGKGRWQHRYNWHLFVITRRLLFLSTRKREALVAPRQIRPHRRANSEPVTLAMLRDAKVQRMERQTTPVPGCWRLPGMLTLSSDDEGGGQSSLRYAQQGKDIELLPAKILEVIGPRSALAPNVTVTDRGDDETTNKSVFASDVASGRQRKPTPPSTSHTTPTAPGKRVGFAPEVEGEESILGPPDSYLGSERSERSSR